MSATETARLLFVHAHPDDETLTTGGTIAHYTARGAAVTVVTCTLGEEGEVIGERYALLAVDNADQLGGYRIAELTQALNVLGVADPVFLGGPGRWRDSGMAGTPPRRHTRFIDAGDEAAQELTAIVDAMRPHVVVTYDQEGGYGHPDHINAHTVTTAAVAASRWRVPKLYWTVMSTSAMTAGIEALTGFPADWSKPNPAEIPFGYADDQIDAVIDATAYIDAKVAALQAHATQVTVAPNRRSCALSNGMALPILAEEHYVLAAGPAGDKDERGWETDLLAGLNLG